MKGQQEACHLPGTGGDRRKAARGAASPRCPPGLHAARDTQMSSCFGKNASAGRARSVSACFDINVSVSLPVLQRVCVCAQAPCPPALPLSVTLCFVSGTTRAGAFPRGCRQPRSAASPSSCSSVPAPLCHGSGRFSSPFSTRRSVLFPALPARCCGWRELGRGPRQDRGLEAAACSVI